MKLPAAPWVMLSRSLALILCIAAVQLGIGCSSGGGTEGTWGRSFSGTVLSESGSPEPGVVVELLETGDRTITDEAGAFMLERTELPSIPVTLRLSGAQINTDLTVSEEIPPREAAVAVDIVVSNRSTARVVNVRVTDSTPTPVPTLAATPSPQATPTPSSVTPTETPVSPTSTPVSSATPTSTPTSTPLSCVGDLNGDHIVDLTDLSLILAANGSSVGDPQYNPQADLNHDQTINQADIDILLSHFGSC